MKLYIKVIAFSEEDGVKATRAQVVDVVPKVLKLNEMVFGNDVEALLGGLADTAMAEAMKSVQVATPGPTGGNLNESPKGKLADMLGLGIIEAMDRKDGR